MATYVSERGNPLVYRGGLKPGETVLTVEHSDSWEGMYLVECDAETKEIAVLAATFPNITAAEGVPYPHYVLRSAAYHEWTLCPLSMELIIGRYLLRVLELSPLALDGSERFDAGDKAERILRGVAAELEGIADGGADALQKLSEDLANQAQVLQSALAELQRDAETAAANLEEAIYRRCQWELCPRNSDNQ